MSLPRLYSHPNPYASTSYSHARPPAGRFRLRRLFKFPQMDFELASWELLNLLISPRKVIKNLLYHSHTKSNQSSTPSLNNPTQSNTYTSFSTTDPALPYLLAFFLFLTSLAWSLAYAAPSFTQIVRIAVVFVLGQFLVACSVTALLFWQVVPRLFGEGGVLVGVGRGFGGGRRRGLFGGVGGAEGGGGRLGVGFAFDIAIRAFVPIFVHLYVLQFLLLPLLVPHTSHTSLHILSTLLSNTLHLLAALHTLYITFLGYSALPFLSGTHLLLAPSGVLALLWGVATGVGWNASLHLAPILWCGAVLRGGGVGRGTPAAI